MVDPSQTKRRELKGRDIVVRRVDGKNEVICQHFGDTTVSSDVFGYLATAVQPENSTATVDLIYAVTEEAAKTQLLLHCNSDEQRTFPLLVALTQWFGSTSPVLQSQIIGTSSGKRCSGSHVNIS